MTEKQNKAWEHYQTLVSIIGNHSHTYLHIGHTLKSIRDDKLFKHLGDGGYSSFREFIANPEVGYKPSTAYLYIRVYSYYVEQLQIPIDQLIKIPLSRLMRLLPSLKKKEDDEAREITIASQFLGSFDFDEEVKEKKLEKRRPRVYKNKKTGRYFIDYHPDDVDVIRNEKTNMNIYQNKNYEKDED